ncbi:MAG TPA: hypothetical protein VM032_14175 [Vicinamibacterales bacterium]|nr:hypothetical protein [Vicinamibacterales bacterium]
MALRETADQIFPELAQNQRNFLLAGAAGAVLSAIGYVTSPEQFFSSYLIAYMLVLGMTLGALGFTMVHQLSGGAWGVVARQSLGAASRVIPYLTILFIPIALGMPHLYEWTHADIVAADEILKGKAAYLNTPFFLVRAVLYFAVWNGLVFLLNKWSREQDETANPALPLRMQRLSAGGLLLYVLTMSFASFDWVMSRDPHWFSTIYGALIVVGQGLVTLASQIVILTWLARRKPMSEALTPTYLSDLAGLMFAAVVLWAYMSFSQYLIIWSGNLPEEIVWYLHRMNHGWTALAIVLVVFHFGAPFFLLLMRGIKRNPALVSRVAMLIIVARVIDLFWLIAPETHHDGLHVSWMDVVLPVTLLAIWGGLYVQQLRQRPLLPVHDPQFEEALGAVFAHGNAPGTAH